MEFKVDLHMEDAVLTKTARNTEVGDMCTMKPPEEHFVWLYGQRPARVQTQDETNALAKEE